MTRQVGIDIVELDEIRERLSDRFVQRVLSEEELARYHDIHNTERKLQFLAGRFAAKEAYTKVYKQFDQPLMFADVTIRNDESGAPYIVSTYRPQDELSLSISHSRNYAVAVVIKE